MSTNEEFVMPAQQSTPREMPGLAVPPVQDSPQPYPPAYAVPAGAVVPANTVVPAHNGYPQAVPQNGYPQAMLGAGYPALPAGRIRGTGLCIFLYVITFGIYGLVWYYSVHDEMKRHSGQGLGGGVGLLLYFFVGFVSPFLVSSEVGQLYKRRGETPRVTGLNGLWMIPGFLLLLVGPIIWFVRVNNALNAYWRSVGAH